MLSASSDVELWKGSRDRKMKNAYAMELQRKKELERHVSRQLMTDAAMIAASKVFGLEQNVVQSSIGSYARLIHRWLNFANPTLRTWNIPKPSSTVSSVRF